MAFARSGNVELPVSEVKENEVDKYYEEWVVNPHIKAVYTVEDHTQRVVGWWKTHPIGSLINLKEPLLSADKNLIKKTNARKAYRALFLNGIVSSATADAPLQEPPHETRDVVAALRKI